MVPPTRRVSGPTPPAWVSLSPCSWTVHHCATSMSSHLTFSLLPSPFLSLSPSSSLLSGSLVGSAAAPAAQIIGGRAGGRAGVGGHSETHCLALPASSEPSEWKISLGEPTVPPRGLVRQVRPSGFSWKCASFLRQFFFLARNDTCAILTVASHWTRYDHNYTWWFFKPFNRKITCETQLYCVEILKVHFSFAKNCHGNAVTTNDGKRKLIKKS